MARLPSRDDLPQAVAQGSGIMVRPAQSNVGEALMQFGGVLGAQAKEDRRKQGVLERARATAYLQKQLMEGAERYTVQNKPDVGKWGDEFAKGSRSWRDEAAKHITDPNERELFMLQAEDDVTRYNINIRTGAQKIQNERQIETAKVAMDQIVDAAALTKDENERIALLSRVRDLGKDLVDSGLMTPAAMADFDIKARQKVAGLVVEQTIMNDPGVAYGALTGKPTESYVQKLGNKENAQRNPKARPRNPDGSLASSALGLFQFTDETWEGLRKKYPELGLTKSYGKVDNDLDGRLDPEQQYRAMQKFTELNAAQLRANDIQVTEATLYLAHFAGVGGAIKLLSADPTAPADKLFPKEAAANPRHFMGKTVAGTIASLTKGFNGQPIKVGAEYASLTPEQRITLTSKAKSAADTAWSQNKDEFATELMSTIADEAMAFGSREEAMKYVSEAEASADVRLKAEQLVNSRWNTQEKIKEEQRQEQWQQTYKTVQDGMDQGADKAELDALANKLTDQNDRASLKKFIADGPPQTDDWKLVNEIDRLRYSSSAEDQKKFIEMDLTRPGMLAGLSTQTRQQMFNQQEAARKSMRPDGKAPVFTTMAEIRGSYPPQLGLNVSGAKPDPEDVAVWNVIQSDIQARLDAEFTRTGQEPDQTRVNQIADEAIISWHNSTKTGGMFGLFQGDTSMAKAISDAYEALPAEGRKPLAHMWRDFVGVVEAKNRETGGKKVPTPEAFMQIYLKR